MQKRGWAGAEMRDSISLERRSVSALEEASRGRNLMDPRCSLEPAYEEDAATDYENL